MKRFKAKKSKNNSIINIGLFLLLILFISNFFYSQRQNIYDYFIKNIFENYDYNIADVNFILKYALNIDLNKNEAVIKNEDDVSKIEVEKVVDDKPIIYLYNTHQEEKYYSNYINGYNVSAGVLQASKILKEYLKEYDINAIVEENSISEKLHSLNLKYGYSYKVSRMFLEDAYLNIYSKDRKLFLFTVFIPYCGEILISIIIGGILAVVLNSDDDKDKEKSNKQKNTPVPPLWRQNWRN